MTEIFADTADLDEIRELAQCGARGFTTNPTLMRKAGITDYESFGQQMIEAVPDLPVSLEVLADRPQTMLEQARRISEWGNNVYVKVPITTSDGKPLLGAVVLPLVTDGVRVNITAVFTPLQIREALVALGDSDAFVSIFAGRIADTGVDPQPIVARAARCASTGTRIVWASCREVLNLMQARDAGCHAITMSPELIRRHWASAGKDLLAFSRETVAGFETDAVGLML